MQIFGQTIVLVINSSITNNSFSTYFSNIYYNKHKVEGGLVVHLKYAIFTNCKNKLK